MTKRTEIQQGQRIGKLTVIGFHHNRIYINPKTGRKRIFPYYSCKCDCGNKSIVARDFLIRKKPISSCGCISKDFLHNLNYSHGKSKTRLFRIWAHIKDRCNNKKNQSYKNYGARGITICDEWKNDFMSFYKWSLSNGYKKELTIERIDVNGGYNPDNCTWIKKEEQNKNTRRSVFLTYKGKTLCVAEWARKINKSKETLYSRIKKGWSIEKILCEY